MGWSDGSSSRQRQCFLCWSGSESFEVGCGVDLDRLAVACLNTQLGRVFDLIGLS
jgi:hypothetical protein